MLGVCRSVPLSPNRSKGAFIMETQIVNASEYRNVPLSVLNESKTNPRRTFEPIALKELAESIRSQGVLSPCWCGLSPRTASRSSREHDVTAPHRSLRFQPCPSASLTCPMPQR